MRFSIHILVAALKIALAAVEPPIALPKLGLPAMQSYSPKMPIMMASDHRGQIPLFPLAHFELTSVIIEKG